jgi:hypothetical protein
MIGLALGFVTASAQAQAKNDPTGTWKVTINVPNGQTIEYTLRLKLEGEKLSGVTFREGKEYPIEEPKIKGDELSFQLTRERDGQKFVAKYQGKLAGDAINPPEPASWRGMFG